MEEKRHIFTKLILLTLAVSVKCEFTSGGFGPDDCKPIVVAHRGASGYVPEHTLGAYALAATMGADYIEPDFVMTKDGYLIARHENELSLSTDVAQHEEFADRYRIQIGNSGISRGWFSEDFTLEEIKTLRAIERIPATRPGNARMDGAYDIPHFQEIIDLVKGLEISLNRTIGIYPEIKSGTHFQNLGLGMEQPIADIFHRNGYTGPNSPVYIQSFEVNNLKQLRNMTDLRLLQLFGSLQLARPVGSDFTYGQMATPEGLAEVATYASAVGPDKTYIIPRNLNNSLGSVTTFVDDAHQLGLEVHPYTFRAENSFLPQEFRSSDAADDIGDLEGELRAYLEAGIDGAFIDQPDVLVRFKTICSRSETNFAVDTKYYKSLLIHYLAAIFIFQRILSL